MGYVNALVVESGILRELPRVIFTPEIIIELEEDLVNDIAGEKEADVKRRERDERNLEELREVMTTLQGHSGSLNY